MDQLIFFSQKIQAIELLDIFKRLYYHPLGRWEGVKSIGRFLYWQIYSRLVRNWKIVPFVDATKLLLRREYTSATGHYYKGLNEYEFTSFLLHFLTPEDLFVDAGANIGAYSILASGVCGARSIVIEPVPHTFSGLKEQIRLNKLESKVSLLNLGLSNKEGQLHFASQRGQQNHVVSVEKDAIEIPVKTLDQLLGDQCPVLVKIDVEGYELPVLEGANSTLSNPVLKAIIVEMMELGRRYGYRDEQVDAILQEYGFIPYQYSPKEHRLIRLEQFRNNSNNIYLRQLEVVKTRLNIL